MREFFKNLYYKTGLGRRLIHPLLLLRNAILPEEILLKNRFKRMLGYKLNLLEPETYNEKLQWLKLNDRSDLHIKCADKYLVREYIKEKIGERYLIPLIYETKNPDLIRPENLPSYPIIIKTNHDSGGVNIIWDKNEVDWTELRKRLKKSLKYKYASGKVEWQYKNIEPRLVVEKLLVDETGNIPSDFKVHCMNGKAVFIQVDIDRSKDHKRNLYDLGWNLIPCEWKYKNGRQIERPLVLDEMLRIAEKLAEDFICVRVDLYVVMDQIFFGELTFHSESGFAKFNPHKWDYEFGKYLHLP